MKHARERNQDYFNCEDQLEKEIGKNASLWGIYPNWKSCF